MPSAVPDQTSDLRVSILNPSAGKLFAQPGRANHLPEWVADNTGNVRQWVLSVPKRLRYFMQRDGPVLNMVLRIFLRVIAQSLQAHCIGAANADKESLHIGAVAFIRRFGSSLNEHVHFHVCVVDEGQTPRPLQEPGQRPRALRALALNRAGRARQRPLRLPA